MKRLTMKQKVSLMSECILDFKELAVDKVLDVSYETKAQGFGMSKMPLNYIFDIDTHILTIPNPGHEYSDYEIKEVIIDYFSLKEERKIKLKEILK